MSRGILLKGRVTTDFNDTLSSEDDLVRKVGARVYGV